MARSVGEWIAKHDDQRVPPRVRQRIFERHGGKCHITGREIRPGDAWDLDHIVELIMGGEHRESNLAPALCEPHKAKTKTAMAVKKKVVRVAKKHQGIATPSQRPIQGRGFEKVAKTHKRPTKVCAVDRRPLWRP